MTDHDINQAIEDCYWRKDVHGVSVCTGALLPCGRVIDTGRCDTIRELFQKEREKEREKDD